MGQGHVYDRFKKEVQPALKSKIEEFNILGYGKITDEELWEFLQIKKWKNPKVDVHLFQIVADILAVQPGEYMNFATVEAFKLGTSILDDEEERRELLK